MLRNYSSDTLDLFKSAINGNRKAFRSLMTTEKRPELAAFSNAIKGDEKARMWLLARCPKVFVTMIDALDYNDVAMKVLQNDEDKFSVSFVLACQDRIEGKYWLKKITTNICFLFAKPLRMHCLPKSRKGYIGIMRLDDEQ